MKTFLIPFFSLMIFSPFLYANDTNEIFGTINQIDYQQKRFDVKTKDGQTFSFMTNDETDVDIENQNYRQDRFYQFVDMRQGDWVQVEYYVHRSDNQPYLADEIDVYR